MMLSEKVRSSAKKLEEARKELDETLSRSHARRSYYASPTRDYSMSKSLSYSDTSALPPRRLLYSDERQYAEQLIDTIRKDNTVEDIRVRLANCEDFNLQDAWVHFERPGKSWIDAADIQYGLDRLGIYRTNNEIELLLRRITRGISSLS